jgi:hypothetical protein
MLAMAYAFKNREKGNTRQQSDFNATLQQDIEALQKAMGIYESRLLVMETQLEEKELQIKRLETLLEAAKNARSNSPDPKLSEALTYKAKRQSMMKLEV